MISFAAVETVITDRMGALWDKSIGPIAYENVAEEPQDIPGFIRIYVRKSLRPMGGNGPGTREGRVRGQIVLVAYAEIGKGKGMTQQMLDAARAIFEEQSFSADGIAVRVEMATDEVSAPNQPWYQSMIALPFWAQAV